MSFMEKLGRAWERNNSMVCVGLDPSVEKLPAAVAQKEKSIFEFNKAIIDATHDCVCCYKPQFAYYAAYNAMDQLKLTIDYITSTYKDIPVILDAKRGDIGSTADMYVREAFEVYGADAVTVNPYMGGDTLRPFLDQADRGVVILCRTSNPGASDLQGLHVEGVPLYLHVARLASEQWNYNYNVMLVVGATAPYELGQVRELCPQIPFLVPGVGAQGGDVEAVVRNGLSANGTGLVVNSSRGILYASSGPDFAQKAREATIALRDEINSFR